MPPAPENVCRLVNLQTALATFATYEGATQSQAHIKPLHWYTACRLVIEGGFLPEEITPRPPFRAVRRPKQGWLLSYDPAAAAGGERTVLGGLKTKNVDVVVLKDGLGPVMAVSCKGAIGAFRNLTNRMEEAVGDCTNLHITYPAMVTGYLFAMRAHRQEAIVAATATAPPGSGRTIAQNDIAIRESGEPVEAVVRFHNAIRELTGRRGIRNDVSRYEAVALALVDPSIGNPGQVLEAYPRSESPLRIEKFFEALYLRYDERYVYSAPDLNTVTVRREWSNTSPAFLAGGDHALPVIPLDYVPRVAAETEALDE